ncbi:MAG TPA: RNA polymerase sigma factor [Solirubrobacterales bacterium]|nr:RNA polymerase sigma factor [Solirubrobacterales bacterium]
MVMMRSRFSRAANPLASSDGFAAFYERNAKQLLIWFVKRVVEPEIAMDLTAETFAQAFRSRGRFRGSTEGEATGWLFGIARHQLGSFIRRGKAERAAVERLKIQVPALSEFEHHQALDLADAPRIRSAVREALTGISTEQQRAVWLRIVEEREYGEVADRLAISPDAARARVHRGLRTLAKHLADHYDRRELA